MLSTTKIDKSPRILRVLFLENDPYDVQLIKSLLNDVQCKNVKIKIEHTYSLSKTLLQLKRKHFDAVLIDLSSSNASNFETFNMINHHFPQIPIVILTSIEDEDITVKTIANGAQDFLIKSKIDGNSLTQSIRFAVERIKINENLRLQKEELSEFAHEMAHDIRNYAFFILGYADLLNKKVDSIYIGKIKESTNSIIALLDRSLKLADAGLQVEATDKINLTSCVKRCADYSIPESITFSYEKLPKVICDREKIYQIFKNLFENAVIHGKPTEIKITKEISDQGTFLIIKNNGKHISPEIRDKIFLRRFSTKKGNKGIGLSIVKKLVEAHGWEISLEDIPETSFRIFIPYESLA